MESQPGSSRELSKDINSTRKRLKRTSFTYNEKHMIINVHKYVKDTWPTGEYPYKTKIMEKTANILGFGVASIYRVIKEYETNGDVQSPSRNKKRMTYMEKVDDFDKNAISKIIHNLLLKGELPTLKKVLQAVNEDEKLPNFKRSTFQKLLKHLKFNYVYNTAYCE